MPTYRIQTSLQDDSGLPRDQYVNSMHVAFTAPATGAQLDAVLAGMREFYIDIRPFLSDTIALSGHTSKAYLVGAPLESPPVDVLEWSLGTGPSGSPLPAEVATCLSYHGSPQPGVLRQSWRGRIFLGPLNTSTVAFGSGTGSRIDATFMDSVLNAADTLQGVLNSAGKWVIFSKRLGMVFPVLTYSMDNEWDTVRSRGRRATQKMSRLIPGGGGSSGSF